MSEKESMEYEKCYVFEPEGQRSKKRRKIDPTGLQASWNLRQEAYEKAWKAQKEKIDAQLNTLDSETVAEIADFLDGNISLDSPGLLPTAIVSTGPQSDSQTSIIGKLSRIPYKHGRRVFVSLSANHGTNLKALLKTLIQRATAQSEGVDDDDDDLTTTRKKTRLLNYDLELLNDYACENKIQQVVVVFQDTEAFDGFLLSELIETLGYWGDRIPFALLLSVATSYESLQRRLSNAALKCLTGRLFDVAPSIDEIERVFDAVTQPETILWMGPGVMQFALDRQNDYIQSIRCFVDAVDYAYMSVYYANALSIFLDPRFQLDAIPADHYDGVRNLQSFQIWCERLRRNGESFRVHDTITKDHILYGHLNTLIPEGRKALSNLKKAVDIFYELQRTVQPQQITPKTTLWIQAMSNKLRGTSQHRSLMLVTKKAPSNILSELLKRILALKTPGYYRDSLREVRKELESLVHIQDDSAQPLRSEEDVKNSTLRTTVIAQKVELSKQKASLSKQDEAYTAILRKFTDTLEKLFAAMLIDPTSLVFHEIFLYDLKSPHREVFTPRPRHAIERALSSPRDYLACDCCAPGEGEDEEATLTSSQPATAILYQLYLEATGLINVSDLWQAFQAVNGDERSEEQNKALFHESLAELEYLGMVKPTKRRVDHVAKAAWKGL